MTQRFVRPSAQPGALALTSPPWPLQKRAALASLLAALWISPLSASAQTPPAAEAATPVQNSALDAPMFYQLLIGELEAQSGRLGNAHEVMLDGARRTKDEGLYRRAVELAIQARAGDSALQAAKAWRQALPQSTEAARTLVQVLVAMDRPGELGEPLRHLLQSQPAGEQELVISGLPRFLAGLKDKALALKAAEQALAPFESQASTQVAAWTARGRVALAAGQVDTALTLARKALGQEPTAMGPTLLALELIPKAPAAEALVQGSLASPSTPAQVRLAYARSLDRRQRLGEAATQLKLALAQQPQLSVAWLTLGAYQIELRESRDGIASLERFLAADAEAKRSSTNKDSDADTNEAGPHLAYVLLAQAWEHLKEPQAASQWLDRIPPQEVDLAVLARRASLLAASGRLTEARALLRAGAAKGNPDARARLLAEAQLLRDRKQWQSAYDLLLEAMRQSPEDSVLIYELAMTADRLKRYDDMEVLLRRVMTLKPDDHHAVNALGYSLTERNVRLDEAQALLNKAASMAPGDPFIIDSLGWVAFRQGRLEQAIRLLQQSHIARPHVEVAAHLGEALWQAGRRDEALQIWREAQPREPDNEVLQETLQRLQVKL
jgi:tetratricopeptide (TPR) repeat protein